MEGEAKGGSVESGSRKRDKLDSDGAKRGSSRTRNTGSIMYKSLRLKQALESKIGRTIEKEIGLKQTERDSIIPVVGQGRRRLKDHIEEFAVALKTSLLLPEMDEGEQKQFVEAKIQEFVSDLSGLRMEKIGKEEDEGGEMQEAEVPEFIRGFKVGVPRAEDCLERSRKARLQTAEKEFLERHRNCKAEVEGAVVIEEEGPGDHLVTEIDEESFAGYREGWEITWGNGHGHSFENLSKETYMYGRLPCPLGILTNFLSCLIWCCLQHC